MLLQLQSGLLTYWSLIQLCHVTVYTVVHILVLSAMVQKMGIREFRNNMAMYLDTNEPVAVTRHGHTVGYFLPTQQDKVKIDSEANQLPCRKRTGYGRRFAPKLTFGLQSNLFAASSGESNPKRLKLAAERLGALLAEHGITEDELFNEFRQLRRQERQQQ